MTSVRYEADGWGVGELWLDGARLVHHELPRPLAVADPARDPFRRPNRPQGTDGLPEVTLAGKSARVRGELVTNLTSKLRRFFGGEAVALDDVELDLDGLSRFHHALVASLREVPRGEVVTYGELAALAGRPGAARAAGTFCARNAFPVFVPCHRVVGAAGIGGYGSLGVDYKRRLLALEDVAL